MVALRQTEIIRAEVDLLFTGLSELSRQVGIQMINAGQVPAGPSPVVAGVAKTEKPDKPAP